MTAQAGKTRALFYRRLYIAYLIDTGAAASVPVICRRTGMPRRTVQNVIQKMPDIGIQCRFSGGTRNGHYVIDDWGPIRRDWIEANLGRIRHAINCAPLTDSPQSSATKAL
ncbi:MAG: hypothetical protein AWU57_1620 [Marinobacter sp. T13-3]|nr:MAG: hypothetical protein AWU57_1620 [Marinobacter sp. T13-3]